MNLEEQLEQKLKGYLEQKYGEKYGVDLELNSSEKQTEVWIQGQEGSKKPEIDDILSELTRGVGILEPEIKIDEYNEERNSYHLQLTEEENFD